LADVGPAEGECTWRQGKAGPGGSLGFARRLPRWGAPARTAPPPGPRPRSGPHGQAAATTARAGGARTASGREHQGDEAKKTLATGQRVRGRERGRSTPHPVVRRWCLPEPVKSASRPSDGLRPDLTEPVRRVAWQRAERAIRVPETRGNHRHRAAPGRRADRARAASRQLGTDDSSCRLLGGGLLAISPTCPDT
jgi:hypothetical protein